MEIKDVKIILDRIKCNYPSFQNDDFTKSEWYKELKDYNVKDVIDKLEQHFRSEQYGGTIPKVYFLTKYLKKENEIDGSDGIKLKCPFCNEYILYHEQPKHYERCSSVDYLNNISKKYYGKEIDKEKYKNLPEEEFDKVYSKARNLLGGKGLHQIGIRNMNEVI